ncbi:MAG: hypothetical protein OXH31_06885 [Gammaproteobacteria bacterium]|nr:hypothetical protein [Gammaproteobacteria bacterium]
MPATREARVGMEYAVLTNPRERLSANPISVDIGFLSNDPIAPTRRFALDAP